jgi:hypothetical protein
MERMSVRENERMDELVEAAAPPKPVYRDA